MTVAAPTVLPADAITLYQSGAGITAVAKQLGCSYRHARMSLLEVGVLRRMPRRPKPPLVVYTGVIRCLDCGERLDQPHVLGAHLPGCGFGHPTNQAEETTHGL